MKIILMLISVCLSLTIFASEAFANTLKKVNGYSKDGAFYAELTFDNAIAADQISLDYINETVQVNLANASMEKSISTKVTDDKVASVYTYKMDNGSLRSRIIYKKGIQATDFQNATTTEIQGNKLVIKVADRGATVAASAAAAASAEKVTDEDLAQASQWLQKADEDAAAKEAEKKALDAKKESEIPILATKNAETKEKQGASATRILLSLGLVLGLLFAFSVFVKKFVKKAPLKKNSQVKILAQHYLGPKKSLAIIRVAGESMLIGVTDNNINLIKTLALLDEEFPENTPNDFSKSLDNSMNEFGSEEAEEFSFSKVKDFVSGRLKNMKEI